MSQKTGFVCHEHYFWHDTGSAAAMMPSDLYIQPDEHAENADTKRRLLGMLEVSGVLDSLHRIKPRLASVDELQRFHSLDYIQRVQALCEAGGGDTGELAPVGRASYEIARLSAGGCLNAMDAVINGEVKNAYVLNRPPGHHAEAEQGRGFCIFGNAVIAIEHARAQFGLERIAVVDWDVHHGNGQEGAFYQDPNVLTLSIHQDNYYPAESGALAHNGNGAGLGANINIPLPPGSGHGAYLHTMEAVILPALMRFKPELIVICSGFDGSAMDPLGRMMAYSETYRLMTQQLMQCADALCAGRLLALHEGGYSKAYVPYCGLAVIESLSGQNSGVEDPFLPIYANVGGQDLQSHQAQLIEQAAALIKGIPA